MNSLKGLFIASTLTICITIMFVVLLNSLSANHIPRGIEVFSNKSMSELSQSNLVDVMSNYVETTHLSKVFWQNHVLTVHLSFDQSVEMESEIEKMIVDLIGLSFHQLTNVNRLIIFVHGSIYLEHNDNVRLATLEIRKTDQWVQEGGGNMPERHWIHDADWEEKLRMNKSIEWTKLQY